MTGQSVLISPYALGKIFTTEKLIHVELTKAQIKNSPPITTDRPVSRQYETGILPLLRISGVLGWIILVGRCCLSSNGGASYGHEGRPNESGWSVRKTGRQ